MSHLTPEKRLDKNGRLVTKHVLSTPAAGNQPLSVPAPALGNTNTATPRKKAEKPFKPRASQLKTNAYSFKSTTAYPDRELRKSSYSYYGTEYYSYSCTEVDVYNVMSVCKPNNAMYLLTKGIRTAEGAREFLIANEVPHLIIDNSLLAQESLKRGISSDVLIEECSDLYWPLRRDDKQSPYYMDAVELLTIRTLRDQSGEIVKSVLDGNIKLSDIKHLGATRLKSFERLRSSRAALRMVNEPDAKYTIDDIKMVLELAFKQGATRRDYEGALNYLMAEGPDAFPISSSLHSIASVVSTYGFAKDRYERATYHLKVVRKTNNFIKRDEMDDLYRSGVDPFEAGSMIGQGMSVASVIGVMQGEVATPVAGGWL